MTSTYFQPNNYNFGHEMNRQGNLSQFYDSGHQLSGINETEQGLNDNQEENMEEVSEEDKVSEGRESRKPNSLLSTTEKCHVCLEPAAKHVHYGAVTCFSCRAFFRRSIQNNAAEKYKCKRQGQCSICLKTRKNCQKCRFMRCLEIGMKPSWVLSEDERKRRFRKSREKKAIQRSLSMSEDDAANNTTTRRGSIDSTDWSPNRSSNRRSSSHPAPISRQILKDIPAKVRVVLPMRRQSLKSDDNVEDQDCKPNVAPPQAHLHPQETISESSEQLPQPAHMSKESFSHYNMASDVQSMSLKYPQSRDVPRDFSCTSGSVSSGSVTEGSQFDTQSRSSDHHSPIAQVTPLMNLISIKSEGEDEEDSYSTTSTDESPKTESNELREEEIKELQQLVMEHDIQYKSVSFGEELVKEMVMSSVFGIPLSPSAAISAYRLTIMRVTKVAQAFDKFLDISENSQNALLRANADLMVNLRTAVFFDGNKKGLDQILVSLGVNDIEVGKKMILATLKTTKELNHINYDNFNSLQNLSEKPKESRYNQLLARVGKTLCLHPDFVKILNYIVLLSPDLIELSPEERHEVEEKQNQMIHMLRRLIFSQYQHDEAVTILANLLISIGDLREIAEIKRKRALAAPIPIDSVNK